MNASQVDSLAHATMAHGLIQLAVHFPDELEPLELDVASALERALGLAERAIALAPELPDGHTALGRVLLCHDHDDAVTDAIEVLRHALELDPEHDPAEAALAAALRARGDAEGALDHVNRVIHRGSGQAPPLVLRALLYLDAGHGDLARRDLERAARMAPDAGLVALDAARAAAATGDELRALALRERGRELLGPAYELVARALDPRPGE